jgi:hypothetical protein
MNALKTLWTLAAVAAVAVVLVACTITIAPRFPDATRVQTTTDGNAPVDSRTLAGGQSVVYAVRVSGSAGPLAYFEVDSNLAMRVYGPTGAPYASSSSASYFESGFGAASTALGEVEAQGITVLRECRGSCVIRPARNETVYVELTNTRSSSVSYRFYAYTADYMDDNEPRNGTADGAVSFDRVESGALETLGDRDYFRVERGGRLFFDAPNRDIDAQAEIIAGQRVIATLRHGRQFDVEVGDLIRVSSSTNRAGPSAESVYYLEIQ